MDTSDAKPQQLNMNMYSMAMVEVVWGKICHTSVPKGFPLLESFASDLVTI